MFEMKVHLNEDDTQAAFEFPERVLTVTAEQLDSLIEAMIEVRSRMLPPMDLPGSQPLR